jgi:hypothetical protein
MWLNMTEKLVYRKRKWKNKVRKGGREKGKQILDMEDTAQRNTQVMNCVQSRTAI